MSQPLATYLNGHLAGAETGLEAATRLQKRITDGHDAEALGRLTEDIARDAEELRRIVEALGEDVHGIKKAAGWVAGKAQRLALAEPVTGNEHLSLLLEAETLALGIEGKLALWQALLAVAPAFPQLADVGLTRLADRARDQRERVEAVRLAAARRAFACDSGGAG